MTRLDRGFVVNFGNADRQQVLAWLVSTMLDPPYQLTANNTSARDDQGRYRWRMALKNTDQRVLFDHEADAALFEMVWAAN
jgi:hypothetical protein